MVHVELSGERGRCWGGEQSWEEMSVFSHVEVSEGGEGDHITGSLEVPDGREGDLAKHSWEDVFCHPTLTLSLPCLEAEAKPDGMGYGLSQLRCFLPSVTVVWRTVAGLSVRCDRAAGGGHKSHWC